MDVEGVTDEQIQAVEHAINLRPRKRFRYKAPIEFIDLLIDFSGDVRLMLEFRHLENRFFILYR